MATKNAHAMHARNKMFQYYDEIDQVDKQQKRITQQMNLNAREQNETAMKIRQYYLITRDIRQSLNLEQYLPSQYPTKNSPHQHFQRLQVLRNRFQSLENKKHQCGHQLNRIQQKAHQKIKKRLINQQSLKKLSMSNKDQSRKKQREERLKKNRKQWRKEPATTFNSNNS